MNIVIYSLVIFVLIYLFLKYIGNASSRKLSKAVRISIFLISIILAILFAIGGRFLLTLPLVLLSFAIVKLKGLTLFQLVALFRLIQTLRSSGRFSFNQTRNFRNSSNLSIEEAYKILNLNRNTSITKEDVKKAHTKIQKKIHPDVSPETSRLSAIVNEAKEVILKELS